MGSRSTRRWRMLIAVLIVTMATSAELALPGLHAITHQSPLTTAFVRILPPELGVTVALASPGNQGGRSRPRDKADSKGSIPTN